MTTAIADMNRLCEELGAQPGVEAELTAFPSGSAMLDVRRAGRAFVMAFAPDQGFAIDELQPNEGFVTGYRFVFDDFVPAAKQFQTMALAEGATPTLSLVVLQSLHPDMAREFYSLLGLSFIKEQHGKGPEHYSTTLGPLVLEIYPCKNGNPPTLRIGFRIPSLDKTLEILRARGTRIVREATDSPWGRRAVVEDPDGNRVELTAIG
jgi:lactoylglutathione lyase